MKKIILALTILATLSSCQTERTTFEINGTVEGKNELKYALIMDALNYQDTIAYAPIVDGKFTITGSVDKPMATTLLRRKLYLENDVYNVLIRENDVTFNGGNIQQVVFGFKNQDDYKAAYKEAKEVSEARFTGLDLNDEKATKSARKAVREKFRVVYKIQEDYLTSIIEGDYPVYSKLFALYENSDYKKYPSEKRIELFEEYNTTLGGNTFATTQKEFLVRSQQQRIIAESVAVGKPFKDIEAQTVDGDIVKLSDVVAKNKYTLLEMWASWCGPCRAEFPHLKKAYSHYHKKGFEIYGFSLDKKREKWVKAMNEEDVPWLNIVDHQGFESKYVKAYGVVGIPASFLINQKGIIVAKGDEIRSWALDKKLKELLGE